MDEDDYWVNEIGGADQALSSRTLSCSLVESFAPWGPDERDGGIPPTLLSCTPKGHFLYAILDAAKVPGLTDVLAISDLDYRCLYKGDELAEVAPWIVRLEGDGSFLTKLFTDAGDADRPWAMWGREPGILLTSDAPIDVLHRHFRKMAVFPDSGPDKVFMRFHDPAVAYTVLDYVSDKPADAAAWFVLDGGFRISSVFTRRRKKGELWDFQIDHSAIGPSDVPRGRRWGRQYRAYARDERELLSSIRMISALRKDAPPSWLPSDDRTLLFYVQNARRAAREMGLTEQALLRKFVYVGSICAPFFWRESQTRAYLVDDRGDPNARFADFYALFKRDAERANVPWTLPED
ncbi:DUF4123 domain-containing protein [Jannaschia marina]|uniref:DUF4123 domain-containing protein n=1 Tax=Jannaschia marina TaxID=2741674 RepID=UPI0015CA7733|nr:DUF4123 domain-containing protein [Jannaschia marina]